MCHVLVVDDDQPVRETIRLVLEDEGHSVTEVGEGDGAVALLKASPESLVALVDLHLGPWTGINPVLTALAIEPALADRHSYIWMTAESLERAEEATSPVRRYGVRLLTKPWDLDVLLDAVADAAQNLPGAEGPRAGGR
jgi:CheY-like chemotaxis protein